MENEYFVHHSSIIDYPTTIGKRTKIWGFSHVMKNVLIGIDCTIGEHVFIESGVIIGDRVKIKNNISIYTGVICEDDVFLGPNCVFTNVLNPRSFISRKNEFKSTLIKKGASIGANSTIICGNTIGEFALVAAGSVITKDVKNNTLVLGNPARFHSYVCNCGNKLVISKNKKSEEYKCPRCLKRYFLSPNSNLKLINS